MTHTVCHSFGDISTSSNLAAILDLWYTSMSYDIGSTTTKKHDPENVGVAVGIFSLCALELEICLGGIFTPLVVGKRRKKPLPGQ